MATDMHAHSNLHAQTLENDAHVHHGHDEHDHHQSFVAKYVFSMDHKTISRQFLITAIIMACIAMILSIVFRLQLAWPGENLRSSMLSWVINGGQMEFLTLMHI